MFGGMGASSGGPAGGMGGLQGSKISLISKSEIRYEGYLYSINPEGVAAFANVRYSAPLSRWQLDEASDAVVDLCTVPKRSYSSVLVSR